jgi:hypothetical protein
MPSPQGGGMVKAAWFRSYAAHKRPEKFDGVVQSWDIANEASELSPHSSLPRRRGREGEGVHEPGVQGKDLYLLHVLRKRVEYPALKRVVREQGEAFDASAVLIEDKASGTQLIQELIAEGLYAVTRYRPQADKEPPLPQRLNYTSQPLALRLSTRSQCTATARLYCLSTRSLTALRQIRQRRNTGGSMRC